MFNVLAKCARYTETTLKLCARTDGDSHEDVFSCCYAMMKFIQDEYTALVVQSTFDPNVSRVFRSLQRNTGFTPEAMEHLRSATTIASAYRPQSNPRARGRGGRHHFQNQNMYQCTKHQDRGDFRDEEDQTLTPPVNHRKIPIIRYAVPEVAYQCVLPA